jgi:hypothetical protein
LANAEGKIAFAQGRHLRWLDGEGATAGTLELPEKAGRLTQLDGRLAFVPEKSNRLRVHSVQGTWETLEPPKDASGEGVWAAGPKRLYYLQIRPAFIWTRSVAETAWTPFLAEGEELENPTDLAVQGDALVVLNRDPAEAVVFDGSGKSSRRFELTRARLWPLQRPVFESPLDYLRPRRCDTARRLWAREDGRLIALFTTEDGAAPRLVGLDPGTGEAPVVREALLALRTEGLKRKAVFQDVEFLPDGTTLVTSNLGGLWIHDANLRFKKEWENLPPPSSSFVRGLGRIGPWVLLAGFLLSLLAAAWPRSTSDESVRPIPRRAWIVALASLLVPGLGQATQKRWGWALFWILWATAWGALSLLLTLRLKRGEFVAPATYIESFLALGAAWALSALQAFWREWERRVEN